jgi:hypothetical protein
VRSHQRRSYRLTEEIGLRMRHLAELSHNYSLCFLYLQRAFLQAEVDDRAHRAKRRRVKPLTKDEQQIIDKIIDDAKREFAVQ